MLVISNVTKRFPGADTPLLKDITFTVNTGERVGLIGPNGSGKTTLLRIIMGQDMPSAGSILRAPSTLRIGYLPQGLEPTADQRVEDVLFPQLVALRKAEERLEGLAAAMTDASANKDTLEAAYSDALERLQTLSNTVDTRQARALLSDLGLGHLTLEAPVGTLSGGQKTRLGLAAVLLNAPDLLILDEPTNHLDISALEWLEDWLQSFPGGALVVSHDRTFLDNVVNRMVALNQHTAKVYEGDYSDYAAAVRSALDKQWARWRDQQVETMRLKTDAQRMMGWALATEGPSKAARKAASRAHAKEKRLERYLASEDRVEKPVQTWGLKLDFDELPTSGKHILTLESVTIGYDAERPLLHDLSLSVRPGERIVIAGPNGCGKSTLLKTIVGELPPLAGQVRLGASIRVGYLAQEQEIVNRRRSALDLLLDEAPALNHSEARSFLHFFLFAGDDALRPAGLLSYGERVRLMLALLVARGANLLILDEPLNYLDVPAREKFEQSLTLFRGSVLAVVHDRYFIDRFATTIWNMADNGKGHHSQQ